MFRTSIAITGFSTSVPMCFSESSVKANIHLIPLLSFVFVFVVVFVFCIIFLVKSEWRQNMHLIPLCSHDTADHPPLQRLHLLQSKGFPQKVALLQRWRSHLQSQKLSRVVLVQHFVSLFLNFQKIPMLEVRARNWEKLSLLASSNKSPFFSMSKGYGLTLTFCGLEKLWT